jgi:hypothetical protein
MRNLIRQIIREYSNDVITFNLKQEDNNFVLYEFDIMGTDFFVRFYEREPKVWRRGYWYKEKNYFQTNIVKILDRLKSETDKRIIDRLKHELEYFQSNVDKYNTQDLLGKSETPIKIVNTLSNITIDFLNRKQDDCDVLEIHHMRKGNEDTSVRQRMTQRSLLRDLNTSTWEYTSDKSTSIIYKKGIDLSDYNLELY